MCGGDANNSLAFSWKPGTEPATVPVIMQHHLWHLAEGRPKGKVLPSSADKVTPQVQRLGTSENRDLYILTTEDAGSCYILINFSNIVVMKSSSQYVDFPVVFKSSLSHRSHYFCVMYGETDCKAIE